MRAPRLTLPQLILDSVDGVDVNCCHDPDCLNFGEPYIAAPASVFGPSLPTKASLRSNSAAIGLGRYRMSTPGESYSRTTKVVEYAGKEFIWSDGREMRCQARREFGLCETSFVVLSNLHLVEEIERLRGMNGALDGPACPACGTRYLAAPGEFIFNGASERDQRQPSCPTPTAMLAAVSSRRSGVVRL